jgi:NADH:ubiquinone oxidoreductase subunit 6 (subunit J)
MKSGELPAYIPTVSAIGHALLNQALLPFEALSIVLLAVVIGAVVIVRRSNTDKIEKGNNP